MPHSNERRCQDRISHIVDMDSIKSSLITDISTGGAGLLILKNKETVSGNICLRILKPDMSSLSGFNINADVVWVDEEHSDDFRKIGVQFSDLDKELKTHISQAMSWLSQEEHYFLRCEVI